MTNLFIYKKEWINLLNGQKKQIKNLTKNPKMNGQNFVTRKILVRFLNMFFPLLCSQFSQKELVRHEIYAVSWPKLVKNKRGYVLLYFLQI